MAKCCYLYKINGHQECQLLDKKRNCSILSEFFAGNMCVAKGPRKRGNIVAEKLLRKHCFLATQTGKHLLKKQNVYEKSQKTFFVSQKQKLFPQQMFPVPANGETFRETTMFPRLQAPYHFTNPLAPRCQVQFMSFT